MKKRVSRKYLDGLVNKIISETLEEKADMLMSKIKTNVNELGGMDSEHPKFGKTKFADMSDEEIDDLINNYHSGDDEFEDDFEDEEDEDEYEGNWVHPLGESEIEDLMNSEVDEQFDSEEMKGFRDNKPFTRREFKKIPKGSEIDTRNLRDDSITMNKFLKNKLKDRFRDYDDDEDFDLMFESDGEVCECGGNLYEGICEECGNTYGMVGEEDGEEDFGYATHDGSFGGDDSEEEEGEENVGGCKTVRDVIKKQGGEMTDLDKETIKKYNCKSLKESLSDNQRKKIDKNKNGKIDSEDFKLLRKKKKSGKVTDVEEGNEFTGELAKAKKQGKDSFEVGGKKFKVKESIQLSEEELIQLIENIIKEDSKTNLKNVGGEPRGLRKYKEVHAKDGKENDDYIKSVAKKMKDYLKDGSKGSYEENPKHFPKGNGELEKMDKKAFSMTDDLEDFNYEIAGLNIPTPDAIEFNEEFMDDLYTGSHKTGNGPGGNAVETDVNKRFNKLRKKNTLKKLKDQSYNRVSQPVYNEKSGNDKGKGLSIKLESTEKETRILNEEFNKISRLISYDRKTQ